ncbi:MAG: RibD family protein [Anaerolineales bacterium]|jgi:GTP cyclohydrolase II
MDPIKTWLAETIPSPGTFQRPSVTLSYAQSLDGCITQRRGQPTPLSGEQSLVFTHRLRAAHDAILVGIGTVLADDPRLTVRLVEAQNPQPIVLDSRLRMPLEARLLSDPQRPVWIATTADASLPKRAALQAAGARLLDIPADQDGRVDLPQLLERLAALTIRSLMVEGGAGVITSFLSQKLVDRIALTIAPVFISGLPAVEHLPSGMAPRLRGVQYQRSGEDMLVLGYPDW